MLPVRDDIEDIPGVWAWDNGGGYLLSWCFGCTQGEHTGQGCSLLCLEGGIDRIEREDGGRKKNVNG